MKARVLVILESKGIELIRFYPPGLDNSEGSFDIYRKVKPLLRQIDQSLKNKEEVRPTDLFPMD
jgi:hypothetical protein